MADEENEMTLLPPDHPNRLNLADEVHVRPPEAVETPSRATYVAVLFDHDQRPRERVHLAQLCERFGVTPPGSDAIHFTAEIGDVRLKWERHGEFSGYTFTASGRSPVPFSEPPVALLPPEWLAEMPGSTIFAAHAILIPADAEPPSGEFLASHFGGNVVVGAEIGGGSGLAFTDFRIHSDGFARFLLIDRSFTARQAGRMLQRLFEIETYRMMSLLALPVAREQTQRLVAAERSLTVLTEDIARRGADDESLLQQLTYLAAELESRLAASQFRFGACRAYHDLVIARIAELREIRLPGIQTIEEFMVRRFTPAAATCASTSQRLHQLSERVAQASALLSTRVDIAHEKQNQTLLESMNQRAKLQLLLQQTVEGLSVAAIVYYVAGLVSYLAKALKAAGLHIDTDIAIGIAIPIVGGLVFWTVRRAHHKIFTGLDRAAASPPSGD
jgi:uncharacterized membrane-anchored protein